MKITKPNLIRLAGLSALIAGLCYVLVGVFHPANVPSSVTTTRWETVHVFACAMSLFGVLGLAGIYARRAVKSGWLGLVGFVMLSAWFVLIMGFSFVEAFVLPHSAAVTPAFIAGWMGMFNDDPSTIDLGALPTLWTLSGPLGCPGRDDRPPATPRTLPPKDGRRVSTAARDGLPRNRRHHPDSPPRAARDR
jgi:hypothetical protein